MSFEMSLIKNLDNQRVLVSEKKSDKKGKINERLYILPEKNVDKFVKARTGAEFSNSFQGGMSTLCSIGAGFLGATSVKTSTSLKIAAGVAAFGLCMFGCNIVDKKLDDYIQKQDMKRNAIEEVTGKDINEIV